MNNERIRNHLNTRRQFWEYDGRYSVKNAGNHRFIARIDDQIAGLSYVVAGDEEKSGFMKMNLKKEFAEYGIGTELLVLLMEDLVESGFETIRYEISKEYYAFQIYEMLGLKVESEDDEMIRFAWKRDAQGRVDGELK